MASTWYTIDEPRHYVALLRFLHGANQIDCGAVVVARLNNPRTLRNAEGFFIRALEKDHREPVTNVKAGSSS